MCIRDRYKYGTTDVTRTLCFSKQSKNIKNIYTKVLKGHIAVATTDLKKDNVGKKIAEVQLNYFDKDGEFNTQEMAKFKFTLLNFWASWCNPCIMIAPHLEAISDEMKEVVVAKHNIDEEPNTPTKFGVRGIPTMLLFKDGELASTKVGATTKSNIQDWIKENL